MSLAFTPKQKLEFLHHAELAGHWYCSHQNTDERPLERTRRGAGAVG